MSNIPNSRHSSPFPRFFPEKGADENDLLLFRDRVINPWSVYRNQRMAEVALWMWYYLGKQWATIDSDALVDGIRGSILRETASDMPGTDNMPTPVTNIVDPAVEQTVIALVQRQWTFKAVPTSADPAIKAAAQISTDVTQSRLETLHFADKRVQHAFNFTVGGTGLVYTCNDRSYARVKPVGAPSAVWCDHCETKLYSPQVPLASLRAGHEGHPFAWADTAKPVPLDDYDMSIEDQVAGLELMKLTHCPMCQDSARSLKPYSPTPEEVDDEGLGDVFGRPLSVLEPCNETDLEIDLAFEWFPQDNGYNVNPWAVRRWGRRKIRTAEWLEERAPDLIDELEPDTVQELVHNDPILGNWETIGSWSNSLDVGILDNHYNVDEVVEDPSIRHPLGRYTMMTKNRVVIDDDLLIPAIIDGETYYVPRVQESVARFKLRPREVWGSGLPSTIISPQNRLNGLDGQIIQWRLMMGSPNVYMPFDMWLDNPVHMEKAYGGGKVFFFQPSVSMPDFTKPEVVAPVLMPDAVYNERDRILQDVKNNVGPQDPSRGIAPKNVGTTSGLQLLVDQEMKSQSIREEELIRSVERSFRHIMRMEWLLRSDPAEYRVLGKNKTWSYRQYTGNALRGQYEIKIERGGSIANTTIQREAAREALADKLIDTLSPVVRRELLELYGLDPNLSPEIAYQVDHAHRVWVDFRDKEIIRVQDTIDDPAIHYLVFVSYLRTEEGEEIADQAGWDAFARKIAGWQDELRRMEEADQIAIEFYGGRIQGEQAKIAYGKALIAYQEQKAVYEQQVKLHEQIQGDPTTAAAIGGAVETPMPPQLPPPPIFLPALLQDRVLMLWDQMVQVSVTSSTTTTSPAQIGPEMDPAAVPPIDSAAAQGLALSIPASDMSKLPVPGRGEPSRSPRSYIEFRALVEAYRLTVAGGAMAGAAAAAGPGAENSGALDAPPPTSEPAPSPESVAPLPEGGQN